MQRTPTRHITPAATTARMSVIQRLVSQSWISIRGIPPAYRLNTPLPKQLYRKLRFFTMKLILHSISTIMSPESPMQAGMRYLRKRPLFCSVESCDPEIQKKTAKPRQVRPTTRLIAFSTQMTSDLSFLFLRGEGEESLLSARDYFSLPSFLSMSFQLFYTSASI